MTLSDSWDTPPSNPNNRRSSVLSCIHWGIGRNLGPSVPAHGFSAVSPGHRRMRYSVVSRLQMNSYLYTNQTRIYILYTHTRDVTEDYAKHTRPAHMKFTR